MESNVPQNEIQLIHAVGKWAEKNFGRRRAPHLGVLEEVGEATHAVLKHRQKIRGFDSFDFFATNFGDALADGIIFLADWCHLHNSYFQFDRSHSSVGLADLQDEKIIIHLLQACGLLMSTSLTEREGAFSVAEETLYNGIAQRICVGFETWGKMYNLNLRLLVASTWQSVSQRDWSKNPQNAHVKNS